MPRSARRARGPRDPTQQPRAETGLREPAGRATESESQPGTTKQFWKDAAVAASSVSVLKAAELSGERWDLTYVHFSTR